jgi:hypothetical protein
VSQKGINKGSEKLNLEHQKSRKNNLEQKHNFIKLIALFMKSHFINI